MMEAFFCALGICIGLFLWNWMVVGREPGIRLLWGNNNGRAHAYIWLIWNDPKEPKK